MTIPARESLTSRLAGYQTPQFHRCAGRDAWGGPDCISAARSDHLDAERRDISGNEGPSAAVG